MTKKLGKVYKTKKTEAELVKDLQAGKSVKAKDLMSAMGITVVEF